MDIHLDKNTTVPLYLQIRNAVYLKIMTKELPAGYKLPAERLLAKNLKVHRNTAVKAYQLLLQEGLITASHISPRGYFVCEKSYEFPDEYRKKSLFSPLDITTNYESLNARKVFQHFYYASTQGKSIPFAGMSMNPEAIPFEYLKQILKETVFYDGIDPYWYCDPQGSPRLRESIAHMLFQRNIYVRTSNIQIVSETFDAISHIAKMYLKKGEYVVLEEPACPPTVNVFINAGARVVFVPMDEAGIRVNVLRETIQKYQPKLIYTMPTNHNPTSISMPLDRRTQFLQCIQEFNIPVIEEDSQAEFNYTDNLLPSLYSMDTSNSVIYIDSSALTFFPGARLGYMLAPDSVIKTYREIVYEDEIFINSFSQYLWSRFIDEEYYDKHKAFLINYYRDKRDLLCAELKKIPEISFQIPQGGLAVWCQLPDCVNERGLTSLLEAKGVLLMPGFTFFPYGESGGRYVRLCFSGPTNSEIIRGAAILKETLENMIHH